MARPEPNGENAQILDEWLESYRGKGTACFTHALEVFFPVSEPNAGEEFERILRAMTYHLGGATVYTAEGTWCADAACTRVDREPVKVISSAHNCTSEEARDEIVRAIREAATRTRQQAVAIRGTGRFWIVPTEQL